MAVGILSLLTGVFYGTRSPDLDDPRSFEVVKMNFGKRPAYLSPAEQRRDIDFLLRGMDEVYSGKRVDPQLFQKFVKTMRGFQAQIHEDISADDFRVMIQFEVGMLEDGHLQFGYWEQTVAGNAARAPAVGRDYASVEIHKSKIGKIHVFRMPTFNPPEWEQGERIVEMVAESLPKADAIILDLRGNAGGYGFIPMKIGALLWGVPYRDGSTIQNFPQPSLEVGRIEGPYAHALFRNMLVGSGTPFGQFVERQTRAGVWDRIVSSYRWNEEAGFRKQWALESVPSDSVAEFNLEEKRIDPRNLGFKKPIFVVVNRNCASACELMVENLEAHPYATTWGENTMGAVQFGSVIDLVLPESQLTVSLATGYTIYKDGRKPDRLGYAPDFPLDPYKVNAVDHIEALIEMGKLPHVRKK